VVTEKTFAAHEDGSVLWPNVGTAVKVKWGEVSGKKKIYFDGIVTRINPKMDSCTVRYTEDGSSFNHPFPDENLDIVFCKLRREGREGASPSPVKLTSAVSASSATTTTTTNAASSSSSSSSSSSVSPLPPPPPDRPMNSLYGVRKAAASPTSPYISRCFFEGISFNLGEYKTKLDAAMAYDAFMRKISGGERPNNLLYIKELFPLTPPHTLGDKFCNFTSSGKVKTCEQIGLDADRIIYERKVQLGLIVVRPDDDNSYVSLNDDKKDEKSSEPSTPTKSKGPEGADDDVKAPDSPAWSFYQEAEKVSGQKRQRKQAPSFEPTFLNDRKKRELENQEVFEKLTGVATVKPNPKKKLTLHDRRAGRVPVGFEWWMDNVEVGRQVEGNWMGNGGYYPGVIKGINDRTRKLIIWYDDGDVEADVVAENVRVLIEPDQKKAYVRAS
jgi:hypothetical protein